jgi:hypothetical protein
MHYFAMSRVKEHTCVLDILIQVIERVACPTEGTVD